MGLIIRVEGLDEALRKLDPKMVDRPCRNFLERASILVQNEARRLAPVDTGRLRGSIGRDVGARQAEIGTNVDYAPYVEKGTRPHFPPVAAVAGWATKRGLEPYAVARGISRRGTKAQPFLEPGLKNSEGGIRALLPVLAAEIEAEAANG